MIRTLAVTLLAVTAATGCTVTSSGVTTTPSTPHASTPTAHSSSQQQTVAKIGSTITLKGQEPGEEIAVKLVKVDATANSDAFEGPGKRNRYFAAQFRIRDVGSKPYNDSPTNGAEAIDSRGQQYDTAFVDHISAGQQFPATTKITPGQSALGWIVFAVAKHAKITGVQFGEDSGFGQTGQWHV
jgi:hypothetical protein